MSTSGVGQRGCHTHQNLLTFTWSVDNFRLCPEKRYGKLESSVFASEAHPQRQWRLMLYPRGQTGHYDNLAVALKLEQADETFVEAGYQFSILDEDMVEHYTRRGRNKFGGPQNRPPCETLVRRDELDKMEELLPNDQLTVICKICVADDRQTTASVTQRTPDSELGQHLSRLLQRPTYSDATLKAGNQLFPVHRVLLSARSPVFRAMFRHRVRENIEGVVHITDVEPHILKKLLTFVYTGQLLDLGDEVDKLFVAADKYQLRRLKLLCEEAMFAEISVENAAELLLLADRHSSPQLKARTARFIGAHAADMAAGPDSLMADMATGAGSPATGRSSSGAGGPAAGRLSTGGGGLTAGRPSTGAGGPAARGPAAGAALAARSRSRSPL